MLASLLSGETLRMTTNRKGGWHRLVAERGWSDDRFAQLLGTIWAAALVV